MEIDAREIEGGPWYTYKEALAMRALTDEHGFIVDASWRKHKDQELWKPLDLCPPSKPRFGTMA